MIHTIQIHYIPIEEKWDSNVEYNVVTVANGVIVSDIYHKESTGGLHLHYEVEEEFIGMSFHDTPYAKNPFIETWFEHEEGA